MFCSFFNGRLRWEGAASFQGARRGTVRSTRRGYSKQRGVQLVGAAVQLLGCMYRLLDRTAFSQLALDYLVFGMAYLGRRISHSGRLLELHPLMAQYMRRGVEPGEFLQVRVGGAEHEFSPGSVHQLREADTD